MKKQNVILIIKETIKLRKEAEDTLYHARRLSLAESYRQQREDLEFCLKLVEDID